MENITYIPIENIVQGLKNRTISLNPNGYWEESDSILNWVIEKLEGEAKALKEDIAEHWKNMSTDDQKKYKLATYGDILSRRKELSFHTVLYIRSLQGIEFIPNTPLRNHYSKICIRGLPTQLDSQSNGVPIFWGTDPTELQLGKEKVSTYTMLCNPTISEVEYEKGFVVQNYFALGDILENNMEYHKKRLDTTTGLQNIQNEYAKSNFMFGQVGNTNIYVYELPDKFIVTTINHEQLEDGSTENETALQWFSTHIGENTKPLQTSGRGFDRESLNLSVRRYEAIPIEKLAANKKARPEDWSDINHIKIPYKGKLRVENYYRQKTQMPEYLVAIWHKI